MTNTPLYPNPSREEIIFALREKLDAVGLNFATFAEKYGWDRRLVNWAAWTYWETGIVPPKGIKTRRILKALEQEIGRATPVTSSDT